MSSRARRTGPSGSSPTRSAASGHDASGPSRTSTWRRPALTAPVLRRAARRTPHRRRTTGTRSHEDERTLADPGCVHSERDEHRDDGHQRDAEPRDRPAVSAQRHEAQRRERGDEKAREDQQRPDVVQAPLERPLDARGELAGHRLRREGGGQERSGGRRSEGARGDRARDPTGTRPRGERRARAGGDRPGQERGRLQRLRHPRAYSLMKCSAGRSSGRRTCSSATSATDVASPARTRVWGGGHAKQDGPPARRARSGVGPRTRRTHAGMAVACEFPWGSTAP